MKLNTLHNLLLAASFGTLLQLAHASPSVQAATPAIHQFETPAQLHGFNVESFENVRNTFGLSRVRRFYNNPIRPKMLIVGKNRVESISLVSNALSKSLELDTVRLRAITKEGLALTMAHPSFVPAAPLGDKGKSTFHSLSKENPLIRDGDKAWGALFAKQQCIRCHENYKVGDVIGAFVYKFERPLPAPEKKILKESDKKSIREVSWTGHPVPYANPHY